MPAALSWLLRLIPTNPICVRLVQSGSRRQRHLFIRMGYLLALILVLLWVLLVGASGNELSYAELAKAGATSFKWTAYLQVAMICLVAPIFMAGAIAQEANPKTWDILLTTPLSAAQIVLGHLSGRLFFVLALLMSSLPLFAITQYFGGAPSSAIFASYAIAGCAALLVGAIAVTLSVSRLAGRRAVFSFYVCVVTYLAATLAIDLLLRGAPARVTALTPLNPFLALQAMISPANYTRPPEIELAEMSALGRLWFGSPALTWCLVSAGVSVLLAALSGFGVRRVAALGRSPLAARFGRTGPEGQRTRAPRHVWHNPIAWREAAARGGALHRMVARWSFVGIGILWGLGLIVAHHRGSITADEFRYAMTATIWTQVAVIALVAMNMSGSAVSREREDGTLDLLLITPVTAGAYIWGKLRGLISFLAPLLAVPIVTLILTAIYVMANGFTGASPVDVTVRLGTAVTTVPMMSPMIALVMPLTLIPFIALCVMVGLQWSIKSRGAISSVIATVGVVLVSSLIVGSCAWKAAQDIPYAAGVASLLPMTAVHAAFYPEIAANNTISYGAAQLSRSLLTGAVVALLAYSAIVYGMQATMVRTFDMTVRRLAGSRSGP